VNRPMLDAVVPQLADGVKPPHQEEPMAAFMTSTAASSESRRSS
jgi:hypothetical protein